MKRGIDPKSWEKLFISADKLPAFPVGLVAGSPCGVSDQACITCPPLAITKASISSSIALSRTT
jgi:hypothetical protein